MMVVPKAICIIEKGRGKENNERGEDDDEKMKQICERGC